MPGRHICNLEPNILRLQDVLENHQLDVDGGLSYSKQGARVVHPCHELLAIQQIKGALGLPQLSDGLLRKVQRRRDVHVVDTEVLF